MTRLSWVVHKAWLSFVELDKAVVHVIRLTSFLGLWFQCVCLLMPSLSSYYLTGVSLTLNRVSLHGCSRKAQPPLLTLDVGYLLLATHCYSAACSFHSVCMMIDKYRRLMEAF